MVYRITSVMALLEVYKATVYCMTGGTSEIDATGCQGMH